MTDDGAQVPSGRWSSPRDKAELDREFSDFYREHLRDVFNYTYYRTGNHHDAEDLTTQTFLQAYRHFERAQRESNGRPLRPWLIRIAHNLAANYYRDRSRKPTSTLEGSGRRRTSRTRPRSWSSGERKRLQVLEGVRALPDDRREALIMRFALGMDNREIARALGRSEGATKVLIHRAIKQLEERDGARRGGRMSAEQARVPEPDGRPRAARSCGCWRRRSRRWSRPAALVDELEVRLAECQRRGDRGARGAGRLGAGRDARPAQLGAPRGRRWRPGRRRARRSWCSSCARSPPARRRAQGNRRAGRPRAARAPSSATRGRLADAAPERPSAAVCYLSPVDDERRPSSKSRPTYGRPLEVDARRRLRRALRARAAARLT